jgi:hypothetical protein
MARGREAEISFDSGLFAKSFMRDRSPVFKHLYTLREISDKHLLGADAGSLPGRYFVNQEIDFTGHVSVVLFDAIINLIQAPD